MVLDKLENLEKYVSLNPLFSDVVEFIRNTNLATHEPGSIKINGDDLIANFNVCKGKTKEEAKVETHDVMIDIQIPVSHPETMGYTPRTDLSDAPYNSEKDITFYEGMAQQYFTVHPGMFVIFFPQDGHAPAICEAQELHKVIFKVKA